MLKRILIFGLLLSLQFSYSQINLLSFSKQDFVYDNTTKNLKSQSDVKKILRSFSFILKDPKSITISEILSSQTISKRYDVISIEDDKVNDLINFIIKDEKKIEYTLMLSIKKNQIVLVYLENNETFVADYRLISTKN
ncbi:hypothetical protein [Flavobacterium sp. 7A]|uniref:hypothetical protein n=1 Tax=Flavobacterium sp. 7A TaxID=2940571 RepID=UPI002227C61D|nr:hypothetical protein [Flavobacterium sp. 7A]MCW2119560.1 hypothetical protein [Flavobacterium sp. 7A]